SFLLYLCFFFSSRRRHTRCYRDWSSDVCSSDLNIPEFRLRAYGDQFHVAVMMNVVVGKAYGHHTPIFASKIRYVIFRPYWNVPPSIARAEILPAIQRDPDYMARENLEIDRKSTRLNYSHGRISYAGVCLKKKKNA